MQKELEENLSMINFILEQDIKEETKYDKNIKEIILIIVGKDYQIQKSFLENIKKEEQTCFSDVIELIYILFKKKKNERLSTLETSLNDISDKNIIQCKLKLDKLTKRRLFLKSKLWKIPLKNLKKKQA